MKEFSFLLALFLSLIATPSSASAQAGEDPAHVQLRALREGLVAALQKDDLDATLQFLHPNVVVTWQNAEVSRGHAGFRSYYERMRRGPERIVDQFEMHPEVDELSILYGGDAAIAFGHSHDHFELRAGPTFDMESRWTATIVKENERWLVAGFHASTNMFDNALMRKAKSMLVWGIAVALLVGIVGGGLVLPRLFRPLRGGAA